MHEVSLCENILKIIQRQAEQDDFDIVKSVTLTVGNLSGASIESMRFAFPLVAKGTMAEGAEVIFKEVEGRDLKVSSLEVC